MPDYIGHIAIPQIEPSGVFPLTPDFPHGYAQEPHVVIHQFGSANAKISQRFYQAPDATPPVTGWRKNAVRPDSFRDFFLGFNKPFGKESWEPVPKQAYVVASHLAISF